MADTVRSAMKVGRLRIDPVVDGTARFPPTASFRGTTEAQWKVHSDLLDADGLLGFAIGAFLIRGGGRTVLVDAGLGQGTILGIRCGALLDNLRSLGVAPEDVTDVVFTHLHMDHIGWAASAGSGVFTNAVHRCSSRDWEHFVISGRGPQAEHLGPVLPRFQTWVADAPLMPGLDTLAAPGHTPGSTVLVVSSGSERAVLLGDVVHCPVELLEVEWDGLADVDPELAKRTRDRLARELEGQAVPVAAAHFDGLHFGRLVRAEGRRRWAPLGAAGAGG